MMRERLVVIGNGMSGIRAVEEVLALARDRYDIIMFGDEPHPAYNRILLSPVLAGDMDFTAAVTHDYAWYVANNVTLHTGVHVSRVHRDDRVVVTKDGRRFSYDRLILATGSKPVALPIPGCDLPGVVTFRSAADVNMMLEAAKNGGKAVVVGGGLLGLEAACGLRLRGMDVTILHLMPDLMERQLDRESSVLLRREIGSRGIRVLCAVETTSFIGRDRVCGVELRDGRQLAADIVVVAAGVRPNIDLAREAGLGVGRGVVVDDAMRTSDPNIFAAGECAEHDGVCHGLVAPLYDMARILAATLTGGNARYTPNALATRLKVSGVDLFSAGTLSSGDECEDLVLRDPGRGIYRRLVLDGDRLAGAILYGDTTDGSFFLDLIQNRTDITCMRDMLIFGRAMCEAA